MYFFTFILLDFRDAGEVQAVPNEGSGSESSYESGSEEESSSVSCTLIHTHSLSHTYERVRGDAR